MKNANNSFPSFPLIDLITVTKIHSLYYYEFPADYRFQGEQHDFWELVYADKGDCFVQNGNERIILQRGEAILTAPNVFHSLGGNGANLFNVFVISFSCRAKALEAIAGQRITVTAAQRSLISNIIKEAHHAFFLPIIDPMVTELHPREDAPLGSQQLMKNYLEELFISLLRKQVQDNSTAPVLSFLTGKTTDPKNLIEAIEKHLLDNLDKDVSITAICEAFHYSKNYICSHFKQQTGYSIMEYYNRAKVERAKELIRERKYSFATIAEMLGFSSPGYFSKTFKRVTGQSPQQYLHSLRSLLVQ